ncbi:DUF6159 family protein [Legionella spiritensis]|uniref:DUF6159 family protein n=1 Tax=Legionella spiritensis TaxID=452 RepID=UPI000F6B9552|nr:DUF6159 family protein [Legionella spiritensis]VEG90077.1 Uncharacterised protein [Legionella spiritensis]
MSYLERIQNSWQFLVDCVRFLKKNPDLFVLPLISLAALGGILASLIGYSSHHFGQILGLYDKSPLALLAGLGSLYFILSFIVLYFNASLVTCVMQRLQGNHLSVVRGLRLTLKHTGPLLQWTLISSTVCLLINSLERLHSAIADFLSLIFGFSWAVTTYFVLPVMIAEGKGPIKAFKLSIQLIGKGWRKLLSVNTIFYLILLGVVIIGYGLLYFFPQFIEVLPINLPVLVFLFVSWLVISKTFNVIFNCALYLNIQGKPIHQFNDESITRMMAKQ